MAASDATENAPSPENPKRLIICCDGTWMNSDNGYEKTGLLKTQGVLQIPSNVTRISRCFKRRCSDGKLQIISYESGVGTGSNTLDSITGGAFGLGLSERVREAYSYLCANYMDGDDIILVGFSRGAFTARSVAGMVATLGLLTRDGVDNFYPIFKDMQHWGDKDYDDQFPSIPFDKKPRGPGAAKEYRTRLEQMGYTRVHQANGDLIRIKAVCVWDTVGSLGVPRVSWLDKIGIRPDNDEYDWHDTSLSDRIEHAFHALALDETRPPFSPAVWERLPENRMTTDLRQVWFPGNHANCGGGWEDQGMANCTLAWMMDQMASVGVEFDRPSLDRVFKQAVDFYQTQHAKASSKNKLTELPRWAVDPIYTNNSPVRPWGLGAIRRATSVLYKLAGQTARTPGLYKPTDAKTKQDKSRFLQDTNERVHSSVRIRLVCQGLGLDDKDIWTCPSLGNWKLKRMADEFGDPIPEHPDWAPSEEDDDDGKEQTMKPRNERWVWEYCGDEKNAPTDLKQRIMVEEPVGPYERYLLKLSGGNPNVYHFADEKGTS